MRYLSLMLFAAPIFAQSLSLGVKGGVPLTDAFSTLHLNPLYSSVTGRYTVGPMAEIGLPVVGLRVEVDALYTQVGWNSDRTATDLAEAFHSTARFGAWDFDALLKHRLGAFVVHPYVGGGVAFRRFFTTRGNFTFPGSPAQFITKQMTDELGNKNIVGVVLSAGVEFGGGVRFAPEFRYTRWLMNNIRGNYPNVSTQLNEAEILFSLTFGRH